jgi:hypothetical protein
MPVAAQTMRWFGAVVSRRKPIASSAPRAAYRRDVPRSGAATAAAIALVRNR